MRCVHKIICLVGRRDDSKAVKRLSDASPDWKAELLPNITLPSKALKDERKIGDLLSVRLGVDQGQIRTQFDRYNTNMHSSCVKRTGDAHKARVDGEKARYEFNYCVACIADLPKRLFADEFDWLDIRYHWRTLGQLRSNERTAELNWDVLGFVSMRFDTTLDGLPIEN